MFNFLRRKKTPPEPPTSITPAEFMRDGYENLVVNGVVVVWYKSTRVKTVTPYIQNLTTSKSPYWLVFKLNNEGDGVWHDTRLIIQYVPTGVDPATLPPPQPDTLPELPPSVVTLQSIKR